jgi:hypothetical protein
MSGDNNLQHQQNDIGLTTTDRQQTNAGSTTDPQEDYLNGVNQHEALAGGSRSEIRGKAENNKPLVAQHTGN